MGDRAPPVRTAPREEDSHDRGRGKLDKSHSTPAYDFDTGRDEPGELVAQVIPESPTTPTDSPTILVHSAEKADQILDFKKSSSQIGEAILQQQNRKVEDVIQKKVDVAELSLANEESDPMSKDGDVILRRDEESEVKSELDDNLELDVEGKSKS